MSGLAGLIWIKMLGKKRVLKLDKLDEDAMELVDFIYAQLEAISKICNFYTRPWTSRVLRAFPVPSLPVIAFLRWLLI